ncbi:MAG: hypothetical protein Kow0092_08730 [Deferrisomatales bacterium]
MGKDYYALLGVSPGATAEEIKQAYRRKALELHPDRNGGSRQAEEAFKALTEAYAVLGDPARRSRYDARRRGDRASGPPQFDPIDLFADLFAHPAFAAPLTQLAREFARQGLRFDEPYLRRVAAGGRGRVFFGGFVFAWGWSGTGFGPPARPRRRKLRPTGSAGPLPSPRPGLLGRLLGRALPRASEKGQSPADIHFVLPVEADVLREGGSVRVSVPAPEGSATYAVRVPAGTRPGTRLRLPGKGAGAGSRRGDLYLEVRIRR